MTDPKARAWKEIDLEALVHNARVLQGRLAPGCRLMAVVKADAYGHGAVPVARHLEREGIDSFAVACLEEGIILRKAGVKGTILVLGYIPPWAAPELCRWQLTQTVADEEHGRALNAAGLPLLVHLALDTGMHRLGIPAEDTAALARLYRMENLKITGVFSHLCVSDSRVPEDMDYTQHQLDRFFTAVDWLRRQGYDPGTIHIQASGGILNLPPQSCDYARAGIALYGAAGQAEDELCPVLSLRARVACVRTLAAGERAGYGLDFRAEREARLAVLTIGYADGLPRSLAQNGGQVLVHGQLCPMVGRMCMDQLFVDVTDIPDVSHGDIATFIGRDGLLNIRAEDLAKRCGTIPNELLARLGSRLRYAGREDVSGKSGEADTLSAWSL